MLRSGRSLDFLQPGTKARPGCKAVTERRQGDRVGSSLPPPSFWRRVLAQAELTDACKLFRISKQISKASHSDLNTCHGETPLAGFRTPRPALAPCGPLVTVCSCLEVCVRAVLEVWRLRAYDGNQRFGRSSGADAQ